VIVQRKLSSGDLFASSDASFGRLASPKGVVSTSALPEVITCAPRSGVVAALSKSLEDVAGGADRGVRAHSVDNSSCLGLGFGKKVGPSPTSEFPAHVSRNRLSFKLMRQVKVGLRAFGVGCGILCMNKSTTLNHILYFQDVFGGLASSSSSTNGHHASNGESDQTSKPARQDSDLGAKKPAAPVIKTDSKSRENSKSELIAPAKEESKKPGWLEELSRRQATRKSGLFNEGDNKEEAEKELTSPSSEPKPSLPAKPSQIREEGEAQISRKRAFLTSLFCSAKNEPSVDEEAEHVDRFRKRQRTNSQRGAGQASG